MSETNKEIFSNPEAFREKLNSLNEVEKTEKVDLSEVSNEEESEALEENEESISTDDGEESEITTEDTKEVEEEPIVKGNFIPKSRLNKEIEKRRSLEVQLQEAHDAKIRYEAQLEMIRKAQEQEYQNQNMTSNEVDLDDIDALDSEAHRLYTARIKELENKFSQLESNFSLKNTEMDYKQILDKQEQAFSSEHPDFKNALSHLQNVELSVAGNFYSPEDAKRAVATKLNNALETALKQGKNGAEMMYNMAKAYGYQPESQKKAMKGANLDAINENMKKSISIQNIGNNASLANNNRAVGISAALVDPKNSKSGIDSDKFHLLLKKIRS